MVLDEIGVKLAKTFCLFVQDWGECVSVCAMNETTLRIGESKSVQKETRKKEEASSVRMAES